MKALEDAMGEIHHARSDVSHADVRTQLESITASLQEMLDTEAGERTDGEVAFGDTSFEGTAPTGDNLSQIEESLRQLADNAEQEDVRNHLESARKKIAQYRTETQHGD